MEKSGGRNKKHLVDMMVFLKEKEMQFKEKWSHDYKPKGSMNNFTFIEKLGQGSFGIVILSKNTSENKLCAIKVIQKPKKRTYKPVIKTHPEIKIMLCVDFEFVLTMEHYFIDNRNIYLVMPLLTGGDFYKYLRMQKKLNETSTKFYAAQIILGIEYLHSVELIYRDLKLANILIGSDGYIKITDFGFCKRLSDVERARTPCGTLHYLAPEIVKNESYSGAIDWWAVGVLIYEMLSGRSPFGGRNNRELYDNILNSRFEFPLDFSLLSKEILSRFFQINPDKRLGTTLNGVRAIKNHNWFQNFDWDSVLHKTMEPPFLPKQNENANNPKRELDPYESGFL